MPKLMPPKPLLTSENRLLTPLVMGFEAFKKLR